jgi:hypothetical protein
MKKQLPAWALRPAGPEDHGLARQAHSQGRLHIRWPEATALRGWVKRQGWPAPRLGFEAAFITQALTNEVNFELALSESGVELRIPKTDHTLSAEELGELDARYAARSADGRPTDWGTLVEALREIRRAVEAGVAVSVEGAPPMRTWQDFYAWAHGRYHMLEDGYDSWIGDDA